MEDGSTTVKFHASHNMGVMADYSVGTGIDGCMCQRSFIGRKLRWYMHDALVKRHQNQVGPGTSGCNIAGKDVLHFSRHRGQRGCW